MVHFNVNTDGFKHLNATLQKLHRAALPNAVRGTLNDAVFDVKTKTMPRTSSDDFVNRTKTFFKANSKFIPAKGFDINTMQSSVGFFENKLKNQSTNYSVKNLEKQETGGIIESKTFIPTVFARTGKSYNRTVRPSDRLRAIRSRGFTTATSIQGKYHKLTPRQQFIAASNRVGSGGFVLYRNILFRIQSVEGKKVKAVPLYTVKKGRSVKVDKTPFMREAAEITHKKMPGMYLKQAERQISKYWK